jgi:hypothetical protein
MAFAGDRSDQLLLLAAVADGPPRRVYATRQGRLRHDPAAPDRRDQIVLADDVIAVLNQINQEIEHLRLNRNGVLTAPHLAPVGIDAQ